MKFCLVCCHTIPRPLLNIQEWVFNASMIVVSSKNDESSCSFILYQFKIYLINERADQAYFKTVSLTAG